MTGRAARIAQPQSIHRGHFLHLLRLVCFMTLPISILSSPACTFSAIAARNVGTFFRTPDKIENPIANPIRSDAKLAVLWVGHSTVLIQIGHKFVITDPVFTPFVGGLSHRLVEPGIALEHLPRMDAVLVSHRHFDHLSRGTFHRMSRSRCTPAPAPMTATLSHSRPSPADYATTAIQSLNAKQRL